MLPSTSISPVAALSVLSSCSSSLACLLSPVSQQTRAQSFSLCMTQASPGTQQTVSTCGMNE